MLSHKSKYALEALLVLSDEYGNGICCNFDGVGW